MKIHKITHRILSILLTFAIVASLCSCAKVDSDFNDLNEHSTVTVGDILTHYPPLLQLLSMVVKLVIAVLLYCSQKKDLNQM